MAWNKCFLLLFSLILLVHLSNAHFVCGEVLSDNNLSSNWMDVKVYYEENQNISTSCKVSYEGKYCCDLEKINEIKFQPGKKIFAQVFDIDTGYVSNIVSLYGTDESYDVFEPIILEKAIEFNNEINFLKINEPILNFDINLHQNYNNLKVILENSDGLNEIPICNNCTSINFNLTLEKGSNNVSLIAFGENEFVVNQTYYLLDYLDVRKEFICEDCRQNPRRIVVPTNRIVEVKIIVDSSHPINAELIELVPKDFNLLNESNYFHYSETHNAIKLNFNSNGTFSYSYYIVSPSSIIQKKYLFDTYINDFLFSDYVYLKVGYWLGIPIFFAQDFSNNTYYEKSAPQYSSIDEPLIIYSNDSYLNLISISPKNSQILQGFVEVSYSDLFNLSRQYNIYSDLSENEVYSSFIQIKIPKNQSFSVVQDSINLDEKIIDSDSNYDYYYIQLNNLGQFNINLF